MIEILESPSDSVVAFRLSGKLHDDDYRKFTPLVDEAIARHGTTRILAQFSDFHGWDAMALWDDIKFATAHCATIERLALVGEKQWEKMMAVVCKPFTQAKVEYFDAAEIDAAWKWVMDKA
ncbi:MAG: STAS/SEC14 domain-containing protein [Planctomycetota bacterium]